MDRNYIYFEHICLPENVGRIGQKMSYYGERMNKKYLKTEMNIVSSLFTEKKVFFNIN